MQKKETDKVVEKILLRSGSLVSVVMESSFPGNRLVGGKYNIGNHTVTLFIEEIKKQCNQLFLTEEYFLQYLSIVVAHEIGHAEDKDLEQLCDALDKCTSQNERDKILLMIEENAWNYARLLLHDIDQSFVDTVIFHSLQPYREKILLPVV